MKQKKHSKNSLKYIWFIGKHYSTFGKKYTTMAKQKTVSIKAWASQVDRLRKFIDGTSHTLCGYVSELIKKDMDRKEARGEIKK